MTEVQDKAFANIKQIKTLELPYSIQKIGRDAFSRSGLTSISFTTTSQSSELVEIGAYAFENCPIEGTLSLPETLQSLYFQCFYGTNITSFHIPASVKFIDKGQVFATRKLESITVDENNANFKVDKEHKALLSKDGTVFYQYTNLQALKNYTIPASVTKLVESSFQTRTNSTSLLNGDSIYIYVPGTITEANSAFWVEAEGYIVFEQQDVSGIENIFMAAKNLKVFVKTDEAYAKFKSTYYTEEEFKTDDSKYHYCGGVYRLPTQSITKDGLVYTSTAGEDAPYYIGTPYHLSGVAEGNTATELTIPNKLTDYDVKVTGIAANALNGSVAQTVNIGAGIETIDVTALSDLTLATVNVDEDNTNYSSLNGVLYNKEKTTLLLYPQGQGSLFALPESLMAIGDNAFPGSKETHPLNLTSALTTPPTLGSTPFSRVKGIYVDETLRSTYDLQWSDYASLIQTIYPANLQAEGLTLTRNEDKTYTITGFASEAPSGEWSVPGSLTNEDICTYEVTGIAANFCQDNSSLTTVTIPAAITTIGAGAFAGCSNEAFAIIVAAENPNYASQAGALYDKGLTTLYAVPAHATTIDFPASLTTIDSQAFRGSKLTTLHLTAGISYVNYTIFNACTDITAITAAENNAVFAAEDDILYNKTKTSLLLSAKKSNATVNVPSTVRLIGAKAFGNCSNLTLVCSQATPPSLGTDALTGVTKVYVNEADKAAYAATDWKNYNLTVMNPLEQDAGHYTYARNEDGTYTLTGVNGELSGAITLPTTFELHGISYDVTSIGAEVFKDQYVITSLTIPEGYTTIGEGAFMGCTGLTNLSIPASVTAIGRKAFYGCSNAGFALTIAEGNQNFTTDANVLYDKAKTTIYAVPSNITTYDIPETVTNIGDYAFNECISLNTINVPAAISHIGEGVFEGCTSLNVITLKEGLESIGAYAFKGCATVTTMTVPSTVKTIGKEAFAGMGLLTSTTLPDGLTAIADGLYEGCSRLTAVTIPAGVTSIGSKAFSGTVLTKLGLPDGLTEIGAGAFMGCKFTGALVPYGVTAIADSTFMNCSNLATISLPSYVTSVGKQAFDGIAETAAFTCYSHAVPETAADAISSPGTKTLKVRSVSNEAYGNATLWKDMTRNTFTTTGLNAGGVAFSVNADETTCTVSGLTSLEDQPTTLNIPAEARGSLLDGYLYKATAIGANAFAEENGAEVKKYTFTNVVIPEGITTIGSSAFVYETNLAHVEFPNSLITIKPNAFANCSNLKDVSIEGIETIEDHAFQNTGIESITVSGNTTLSSFVFQRCESLKTAVLKEGITIIPLGAFVFCDKLESISLPSTVEVIKSNAFWNCTRLVEANMPSSLKTIEKEAFQKCKLTEVSLPEGLQTIGENAFCYNKLTEVILPASLTKIGANAFQGCRQLNKVVCRGTTPATLDNVNAFAECRINNRIIVPKDGLEAYRAADNWKDFLIRLETFVLDDTAESYVKDVDDKLASIEYTRNFANEEWTAWYVPFDMPVADIAEDFEMARINDIHQNDTDDDGTMDETLLEVVKLKGDAVAKANTPYLIKAKTTGEKTFTLEDVTLYATKANSFDVTSWNYRYIFTGTYSQVSDMYTNGYYALGGGSFHQAASDAAKLGAFRWFLRIENRASAQVPDAKPTQIRLHVVGEDGEATGIDQLRPIDETNNGTYTVIDGSGRLVRTAAKSLEGLPSGFYIINGKKTFIK
ncbi:MAG: leucine-rich repeat domain-containing protein [Prevotellamassilia sp.]|nr:leucine-rich repeat domain-containing protein [Prevotellamassilia sp.]